MGCRAYGNTANVLGDTAAAKVWSDIGFDVETVNGHDIPAILETKQKLMANKNGKPKLIIANTVKGKGISYMENKLEWHYLPMNEAQYNEAIKKIETDYSL